MQISDQIAADRYSYMAMLGRVVLLAAGLCRFWQAVGGRVRSPSGLATAGLALLIVLIV